ncbi:isovaleryl-CoA dehydrogenase, mitochondrial [Flavobacteriaceae bacterium UJ101]|nr:isovaleryl-CoA dehydrogenase, mitochondrial [Flavobacteriaceae bacterium UJ101]
MDLNTPIAFDEFIKTFKNSLKSVFHDRDDIQKFSLKRSLPPLVMREIMANKPLSVAIPKNFGGRGVKVKECLGILEAASYESLPLSLTFGINIALFLEPVAKYAQEAAKGEVFKRFLEKQNMGGLMITEPDYGSDALNMQTHHTFDNNHFTINGTKHWQGLTGLADYWLITSRNQGENGKLDRDIDFFIADNTHCDQRVHVSEYYNNLGLYMIPYGINQLKNIRIPKTYKLTPESTGLKLMLDLLHRSRMQFPGMGMGFVKRMYDEGLQHTRNRIVGNKPLFELDQVRFQLSRVQNAYTICSAMCARSAEKSGIENDLSSDAVEANSIKTYITDLMQESSQTVAQLFGGNGYKMENIATRGIVDSRPFQIFEGSNEMLYTQISEMVLKMMKRSKEKNFLSFLSHYNLTEKAADLFKSTVNFSIEAPISQRKMVDLGKIISRIISANLVINLEEKGFRKDLIQDSLQSIQHEVSSLIGSFNYSNSVEPKENYQEGSAWLKFV